MSLVEKIKQLYPEITDSDFPDVICVRDDADGTPQYIAKWEHPTLVRPTDEELA